MREQLHGLTVLRGFAALWVALHHAFFGIEGVLAPQTSSIVYNGLIRGWLGVDLFFILSGFIISYSTHGQAGMKSLKGIFKFLFRRFARIYPAHIFVLLLFVIIVGGAQLSGRFGDPQNIYTTQKLLEQVFLLNGIGFTDPVGWNVPTWSVSSEFLAYLLFPLLTLALTEIKSAGGAIVLITSILGTCVYLAWNFNVGQKYMLGFEFTSIRVLSEFLLGMALYKLCSRIHRESLWIWLFCFGVGGIVLQGAIENSFYDFMYLVYFMALIWSMALAPIRRRVPFFSLFGEISYSFYLIHSLIIILINQLIRSTSFAQSAPWLSLSVFILISGVLAYFIFRYVEVPARKKLINLLAFSKSYKALALSLDIRTVKNRKERYGESKH